MSNTKYIVVLSEHGVETVAVFGTFVNHSDMAALYRKQGRVVAAGFCDISPTPTECGVACWGESMSLRQTDEKGYVISLTHKSRGERDERLIREQILNEEVF
jgi:hypothetical protein